MWAANSNTPLAAAIAIFDELLEDASSYVRNLFAWLPGDARSMAGAMPLTIPLKERGVSSPGLECALITAGSFQADISKEYGPLTRFEPVHFLMLDEAQGFGKWSEALLLIKVRPDGCILPIGDPAQPGGASYEELQKKLLKILEERHPGFRHWAMRTEVGIRLMPALMQALMSKVEADEQFSKIR